MKAKTDEIGLTVFKDRSKWDPDITATCTQEWGVYTRKLLISQ